MSAKLSHLMPVDFTKVSLKDGFWAPRVETNRKVTLGAIYKQLKETGRLDSIDPSHKPGDRTAHHIFYDSDVAKWIEAASYSLALYPDPELENLIDDIVEKFAGLARPDGYINSWFNSVEPDKRWTNIRDLHEMYCAGHMMEAAVAYYRATGKRRFLDMVCRYADHIDSTFGPEEGKLPGYPGHQEIELALIKLYSETGNERYLRLAQYFVNRRGTKPHYYDAEAVKRGEDPSQRNYEYQQAHLPIREQTRVVGHAVRAMYFYSGVADVARETGDPTLMDALRTLWDDLTLKNLYITAGIGQTGTNEGFTFGYDLPEETAYCETCASIGLVFWNHRMLQLERDAKYADQMEMALYNGALSGVSLSGDKFFYVNPLASRGDHHRQEWFRCACCPPNIARMVAGVGQYMYSQSEDEVYVHLFVQGGADFHLGGRKIRLDQVTQYPWDGRVEIRVGTGKPEKFTLALRIPGWCRECHLRVNGQVLDLSTKVVKGYAMIDREWLDGDKVTLELAMPVERVVANPLVRNLNGNVALVRGPIVYCMEQADNEVIPLNRISLPRNAQLIAEYRQDLLGGVVILKGEGLAIDYSDWSGELYRTREPDLKQCFLTLVPYCVWDNRDPGEMLVWIRESR